MKKKVVLIVQARMGSTRLPGKSMMDLVGAPLVGRILERVKRCECIDELVLAIPDTPQDDVLSALGKAYDVNVFRGPENDLVERFYQAARLYGADIVGRLPADNAVPEPAEIDRIANYHRSLEGRGFSSNLAEINGSGYPDGIGAEMFDFSLLEEVRDRCRDVRKREHVHLNFFDYGSQQVADEDWCPVRTVQCPADFRRPDLVLDVNTQEQFDFIRRLYEYIYPKKPEFHITDVIDWYDNIYLPSLSGE